MSITFAVTYSTLSTEALTTEVLPDFDIREIAACQFFIRGFNDTYRVKNTQGVTYYLRVYRSRWRSLPDIVYELDVLNHLHRKGFAATRPLPRRDGNLCRALTTPESFHLKLFYDGSLIATGAFEITP